MIFAHLQTNVGRRIETNQAYDVLSQGKVVGWAKSSRVAAADGSGTWTTRMRLEANGTTVTLDAQTFFSPGGVIRRVVRSATQGGGAALVRTQTIADFDASGVTAVVTAGGRRRVERLPAPPGLRLGNPWRLGPPRPLPATGSESRFAEFDATAVRWRTITARFVGAESGTYRLEFLDGDRLDRETVDARGDTVSLETANGFALRRTSAAVRPPRPGAEG